MRRGLWFVAGAGAGIYASVRARRVKDAFTPDGLADRWHALSLGARMFRDEVARGQAEAETELRERFGLVPHGRPQLTSSASTAAPAPRAARPTERLHPTERMLDRPSDTEGDD